MKVRALLIPALCALAALSAPARAAGRTETIEARLEGADAGRARGTASLRISADGMRFSIKTNGLTPGPCEVRVGGALEGLLFVEETGSGEILFDTPQFEKTVGSGAEPQLDVSPLTFDPRGKTLQISRNGQNLLEAIFPARPQAGRR